MKKKRKRRKNSFCNSRSHGAPLRHGARHNGSGGGSESELEEPLVVCPISRKEEVTVTNESLLAGVLAAVREGPAEGPETDGTAAGVEEVLEHYVLDVLGADGAGAEHGEAGLGGDGTGEGGGGGGGGEVFGEFRGGVRSNGREKEEGEEENQTP